MKVTSESEVAQSCPTPSDPWGAAYQAPPSMGFSRQEYWSGVPLPSPKEVLWFPNFFKAHDSHGIPSGRTSKETREEGPGNGVAFCPRMQYKEEGQGGELPLVFDYSQFYTLKKRTR